MIHAIPVIAAVVLCLALSGVVWWDLAPLFLKPRTRLVRTARPGGPPPAPAPGAGPARTRTDLVALRPVNGVLLADRPRETPHVTVDGPVVPRWFREWEQGRWGS